MQKQVEQLKSELVIGRQIKHQEMSAVRVQTRLVLLLYLFLIRIMMDILQGPYQQIQTIIIRVYPIRILLLVSKLIKIQMVTLVMRIQIASTMIQMIIMHVFLYRQFYVMEQIMMEILTLATSLKTMHQQIQMIMIAAYQIQRSAPSIKMEMDILIISLLQTPSLILMMQIIVFLTI